MSCLGQKAWISLVVKNRFSFVRLYLEIVLKECPCVLGVSLRPIDFIFFHQLFVSYVSTSPIAALISYVIRVFHAFYLNKLLDEFAFKKIKWINWSVSPILVFQFNIDRSHGKYNWMLSIRTKIVSSRRNLSGFENASFIRYDIDNDFVYIINVIFILGSQFVTRIRRLLLYECYIVHVYCMWTIDYN